MRVLYLLFRVVSPSSYTVSSETCIAVHEDDSLVYRVVCTCCLHFLPRRWPFLLLIFQVPGAFLFFDFMNGYFLKYVIDGVSFFLIIWQDYSLIPIFRTWSFPSSFYQRTFNWLIFSPLFCASMICRSFCCGGNPLTSMK